MTDLAPLAPAEGHRVVAEADLRRIATAALYWEAVPENVEAVRRMLPDLIDEILGDL